MYYFIINPASGSGRGITVWKTIEAELKRLKTEYRAFILSKPGEAKQLLSGLGELSSPLTVVAVGGDGTINDCVSGLTSFHNITFACIPTGSGNDFVRGLQLNTSPLDALHAILNPKEIRPVNIGKTTAISKDKELVFSYAVSSGLGYDAAVCDSIQHSHLKKILNLFHCGKVVYLLTALWQLITMKRNTMDTVIDGKHASFDGTYFAAAMNLRYEGGGFKFCPDALSDDDHIDLLLVDQITRFEALLLLPKAFTGKHVGKKGIHIFRCKKAELKYPHPICLHTDGEVCGYYDSVIFELREEKLNVIIR